MYYTTYTLGHSSRKLNELLDLFKTYNIERVIDIRRWNTSKKFPWFSGTNLENALRKQNIEYYWFPELGGYRKFNIDIEDYGLAKCFEAEGFRAYATYITMNPSIKPVLDVLVGLISEKTSTLMCSERYPWMCHRKILSDYLVAKGLRVLHIVDVNKAIEHKLSKCAVIIDRELKYV